MDIFLRFKSKSHREAYSQGLELQLRKRCVTMTVLAVLFILINIISYAIYPNAGSLGSKMLVVSRIITGLIALLGICLMKRKANRFQRYAFFINIVLDILLIFISFAFYPLLGNVGVDGFSKLGVYVIAWSTCYAVCFVSYLLAHWWMRIVMLITQMSFFLVFVMEREPSPVPILLLAIEGFLLFLSMNYIQERYERLDFFEKRKMYDNYEAIKKIFDDISQAIMIVDTNNQIVYSNQAVHQLFNGSEGQNLSVNSLFSLVKVKSMFPNIETLITEQIVSTREEVHVNSPIHSRFFLTTSIC